MTAQNDTFVFLETFLQDGLKALFGNIFNDNGAGADTPGAITHINGVELTPDNLDFVYIGSLTGPDLYIGTGGSTFPDVGPGDFQFFFRDHYDYLPAGETATVSFDYTIFDGTASSTATVNITIQGTDSNDQFLGTNSTDTIRSGIDDDTVFAFDGNDYVYGGTGADTLDGGLGNDLLFGEAGRDTLRGGGGNDRLYGGLDRDSYTGGAGRDLFVFTALNESSRGRFDAIQDLNRIQGDDIDLRVIDANARLAGNQSFKFIGANAFSKIAGELRYTTLGGASLAQGDTNGDGRADIEILVNKFAHLRAGDFLL